MPKRKDKQPAPVVFISSTSEDLKPYREAAKEAAIGAGFLPKMMEYFPAEDNDPLPVCLEKVKAGHVVVAIVAHRYGWVPKDQPPRSAKSITWLECEQGEKDGQEVLGFVVDSKYEWPVELTEEYRLTAAAQAGEFTELARLGEEVKRNIEQLKKFKKWLSGPRVRSRFTTPESLGREVERALREWRGRNPEFVATAPVTTTGGDADPKAYLEWLREESAWIDIRGLQVGTGKAHRFPIEDLYIPLTTAHGEAEPESGGKRKASGRKSKSPAAEVGTVRLSAVPLEEALRHRRLVIIGDPGSGKTTFLRRIAFELCRTGLGERPASSKAVKKSGERPPSSGSSPDVAIEGNPFPILIRVAELAEHVRRCRAGNHPSAPTTPTAAGWLPHFLGALSHESSWGLSEDSFREHLKAGSSIVLLDGLDEAADRQEREEIAALFEKATRAYKQCRFVATTRPRTYTDKAVLADFEQRQIALLESDAIDAFLDHWSRKLFPGSAVKAKKHKGELSEALQARPDIRLMARNPVMLTALAVVHWNERRLPEQRADLYESVLLWLARSREKKAGRLSADRSLEVLRALALAMQAHPEGRQVQVSRRWAAEAIATEFPGDKGAKAVARAERFLDDEEVDSGIVVRRGTDLCFWHLTFQEYLAARAIAGLEEPDQKTLLLTDETAYKPEWREVMLLLGGVLHVRQGLKKVDGLISALLKQLGTEPSLATQARCAGLLGAMVRDLKALDYTPADPLYQQTMDAVLRVFDPRPRRSKWINLSMRIEAADALGQAGDPRLEEDNWVTIPAGSFLMGRQMSHRSGPNYDPEARVDESPVHEVRLDSYQMARYPVTVQEYQRFMDDGGYTDEVFWKAGGFGEYDAPHGWEEQFAWMNSPVVGVSWFEASAYCLWACSRLPTEAEWERAARGTEGRKYPWGDEEAEPQRANYGHQRSPARPTPVGLYPAGDTPEGIHDMAGNVWEWASDWYGEGYYRSSAPDNPKDPANGASRVLRGGSWDDYHGSAACAFRYCNRPALRVTNFGFRCTRTKA
jgi:formylglycine-generating enzyme required for sulfatase activity